MRRLAALLLALAPLVGCGGPPPAKPVITLVKPTNGTVFPLIMANSVDIEVEFTVSNISLVKPMNQGPIAGEGHCHLFLDDAVSYTASGPSPLKANAVPAGDHTLKLTLVENDHTPIAGVAPVTVMVRVQ